MEGRPRWEDHAPLVDIPEAKNVQKVKVSGGIPSLAVTLATGETAVISWSTLAQLGFWSEDADERR